MKSNFEAMTQAELRDYVLKHRGDREAFEKWVDRATATSSKRVWHPYPQSAEDINQVFHLLQKYLENSQQE